MTDTPTTSNTAPQAGPTPDRSPGDADSASLAGWPLALVLIVFVAAVIVGAFYVDPLVSVASGLLVALGVGATFVGVWLDDQDGPAAIGAPVVLFAAVVFFLTGVMTFAGVLDVPGMPSNREAEPEFLPDGQFGATSQLDSSLPRDHQVAGTRA
ncbi:MAG: hypothetical protein AB7O68_25240 [Pirellulales bacterium]